VQKRDLEDGLISSLLRVLQTVPSGAGIHIRPFDPRSPVDVLVRRKNYSADLSMAASVVTELIKCVCN
jgi:hypothetical protein